MIRTQISFDRDLYERAKRLARQRGISLAELCRRSLTQTLAGEPVESRWMAYAGTFEGCEDDSVDIDAVVYDREHP